MNNEHNECGAEVRSAMTWNDRDCFVQRIEEEIYRAWRYDIPISLLVIDLPDASRPSARALHKFVTAHIRRLDFAGILGDGSYAVCLPHTPVRGAAAVAKRLGALLSDFRPVVGVASFPDEGTTAEELLRKASTVTMELAA